jgi:hypothetical protein
MFVGLTDDQSYFYPHPTRLQAHKPISSQHRNARYICMEPRCPHPLANCFPQTKRYSSCRYLQLRTYCGSLPRRRSRTTSCGTRPRIIRGLYSTRRERPVCVAHAS